MIACDLPKQASRIYIFIYTHIKIIRNLVHLYFDVPGRPELLQIWDLDPDMLSLNF